MAIPPPARGWWFPCQKIMNIPLHDQIIITSSDEIGQDLRTFGKFSARETIGMAIVNLRGILAGNKNTIVGK